MDAEEIEATVAAAAGEIAAADTTATGQGMTLRERWRRTMYFRNVDCRPTFEFGYWHETYQVDPDHYECIYGSMPRFGLARAAEHVAIAPAAESARDRLDR